MCIFVDYISSTRLQVMTTEVYRNMLYESGKNSGGPQKATAAVELRDVFAVVTSKL